MDVVSVELLIELCDNHISSTDLVTVRDLCMITLGFAGFFSVSTSSVLLDAMTLKYIPTIFAYKFQKVKLISIDVAAK